MVWTEFGLNISPGGSSYWPHRISKDRVSKDLLADHRLLMFACPEGWHSTPHGSDPNPCGPLRIPKASCLTLDPPCSWKPENFLGHLVSNHAVRLNKSPRSLGGRSCSNSGAAWSGRLLLLLCVGLFPTKTILGLYHDLLAARLGVSSSMPWCSTTLQTLGDQENCPYPLWTGTSIPVTSTGTRTFTTGL